MKTIHKYQCNFQYFSIFLPDLMLLVKFNLPLAQSLFDVLSLPYWIQNFNLNSSEEIKVTNFHSYLT